MRLGFLILFTFSTGILSAQTVSIDSLNHLLKTTKGLDAVPVYQELAIEWADFDNQKAQAYTKEAYKLAQTLNDSLSIMASARLMGQILARLERYDSSFKVLTSVMAYAKRHKINRELVAVYQSLGRMNLHMGKYAQCLKYYEECLRLPEIEERPNVKWALLNNTGLLFYKIDDPDRALEFFFRTLNLHHKIKEPLGLKNTSKAMTSIKVMCTMSNDDLENRTIYLNDIRKLSCKVRQYIDAIQSRNDQDSVGT
jgi:two-component system, NarL family, sensor kinase